ncbi:hypothetical protein B0H14DRAFT_3882371 [Mycena olivaceomarginata]|nr:hypothetical protein B0H14DRAFT_3882371 [Mycena olivaceomarginata]
MNEASHVLSNKSRLLDRDTFVFASLNPSPSRLLLGFNQKLTPVSSATIQRWVRIITPKTREFVICPVVVHSIGVFEYYIEPSGPPIEATSPTLLLPGNYGLYHNDACIATGPPDIMSARSWSGSFEHHASKMDDKKRALEYQFLPEIERSVMARDNQTCWFTGATDDIALSWIFPPVFRNQTKASWFDVLDKEFVTAKNVLTLKSELKLHFHSNNFTVDVDDDYRIVILRDMGRAVSFLPTRLSRHQQHDTVVDSFLRDHFRYSLGVMILGGDIRETYSRQEVLEMIGELVGYGRDDDRDAVPLTDERWKTDLGQEILANEILRRLRGGTPEQFLSCPASPL